jgi:hypothetical protein
VISKGLGTEFSLGRAGRLTSSSKTLPQLWQTDSRIFLILVTKPGTGQRKVRRDGLEASKRTDVEDGHGELNVTKVTGALEHVFTASTASNRAIDGTQLGVVQALFSRTHPLLVHGLWVLDVTHTHVFDLLGREETKLDLLNGLQRSAGIGKRVDVHGGGC